MTPLTPEAKRALSTPAQFYRELGIHSFYRRSEAPVAESSTPETESPMVKSSSAAKPAPAKSKPLPVLNDLGKSEALDAIRADIGDCTRCRLSKERTNIVFGTGNM